MNLTISTVQLSLATQGDDVARLQQALQALGRTVPPSETSPPTMGSGTVAIVKAVQQDLGVPVTGVVDAPTVGAINKELAAIAGRQRTVRGVVSDNNGNPMKGLTVAAFRQTPAGEVQLAGGVTGDDGSYAIQYHIAAAGPVPRVDLRLQVVMIITTSTEPLQRILATIPSSKTILTDAGLLEVVDFVLATSADVPQKTEYEQLVSDLAPLLGTRTLASLQEDDTHHDVSLLVAQSGYSTDQVASIVRANQLAPSAGVPPQLLYAFLRQGLPGDLSALQKLHPGVRLQALRAAVNQARVPAAIGGKNLEDLLASLAPISAAPLRSLLSTVLPNTADQDKFVALYAKGLENLDTFWKQVTADPTLGPHAADLQFTIQVAALTNKNEPLVKAVKALPGVKQASDLVRISRDQWKALIQTSGVGVPPGTPGANVDEQVANYTDQIVRQVEAAFPTAYFAQQLPASPVKTFLQKQTSYDLTSTYPAQFFKQNPAAAKTLAVQDQGQLLAFQRIYRLTRNTTEALALSSTVHSAQQIARMDRQAFASQFKTSFSAARADEIYDQALRTNALSLALYSENAAGMNRTPTRAIPTLDPGKQAAAAQASIPNWQTLFGSLDFCDCEECSAAHGPAAYFVDILSFLDQRPGVSGKTVRQALFAQRPDLGDIELSCGNTNTTVPTIDVVNEILEDAVSPPGAFTPFTLVATLESDLNQTIATPALAGAFHPPLQQGTQVDVLETGNRWRVWDAAFAYTVVKSNNVLTVAARSRQTAGSDQDRRATPQYRNDAAYSQLKQAFFPWNLPFDLATDEATVFLTHLGVTRYDLIESLRPAPDPFVATSAVPISIAAERLGMTDTERRIIVGEQQGDTLAQFASVQDFLDRSNLSYADLDALIDTSFINSTNAVSIVAPAGNLDTCDTTVLQIHGLNADVLNRIQQFVRLWRKLGWTIADTDRVVRALLAALNTTGLTNEFLVRLDDLKTLAQQLRLSIPQALALWRPLDTVEPGSLYRSLFFNPAVFRSPDDAFRLNSNGQELADLSQLITGHASAIQSAFRLDSASLARLVAKTDGKLNLANLSLIFRHAVLANQLGLSVQDLLVALDLSGLNPFALSTSQDTLRFIGVVQAIQRSGFNIPQIDYLVRHEFNAPAPFVPLDSELASTLTDLQRNLIKIADTAAAENADRAAAATRVLSSAADLPKDITAPLLDRAAVGDPAARQRLINVAAALPTTLKDLRADVLKCAIALSAETTVVDRTSAALSLPGDVTATVLTKVTHQGGFALQRLIALSAIDPAIALSRDNAAPQFETLEKLLKVSSIIRTIGLPDSQLDWLFRENPWLAVAPDPPATPVSLVDWYPFVQLTQLRQNLNLTDAALEAVLGALTDVARATTPQAQLGAKQGLLDTLFAWQNWSSDDLASLIGQPANLADQGLLNAKLPGDYRLNLIARIGDAMRLVKRIGVTVAQAAQWCNPTISDVDAKAIRGAAKAKYDDDAWGGIVTPLQNALRDRQREALASYLVARPANWNPKLTSATINDLFDHFLIDVEMTSCQLTSRIKQAIGSVQLFAQRCLMGLQTGIDTTTDEKWAQWDWMKNFRVWEANRKIWLYPENWIEPELRDDKSPFFEDLENELIQSDLDNDAAEQALMGYLDKLDAVSRLQIAAAYEDDDRRILHVFGRSFNIPHTYYYRRREGVTQSWTPWEKLDLDISGDHLIPVMWHRKLMLIWPILTQKQMPKALVMPGPNEPLKPGDPYWEIQLAWSEYQYGRWSGKNLSDAVTLCAWQGEDNILFGTRVLPSQLLGGNAGAGSGNTFGGGASAGPVNAPPPLDNSGSTHTRLDIGTFQGPGSPDAAASDTGRQAVPAEMISFKGLVSPDGETLAVRGYLRRDYRNTPADDDAQIAFPFGELRFSGCQKIFNAVPDPQMTGKNFALAPAGTKFDGMWFSSVQSGLTLFDGTFPVFPQFSAPPTILSLVNDYASIAGDPSSTKANKINIPVFDETPSPFQLLAPHQDLEFTAHRPFFFGDGKSAFICDPDFRVLNVPGSWVNGDVATVQRADYFGNANLQASGSQSQPDPLTVLLPGPGGRRIARQLTPVKLSPDFSSPTALPTFVTLRLYRFANFCHPQVCEFIQALDSKGISSLMSNDTQKTAATQSFNAYAPKTDVAQPYPPNEVEFETGSAYEIYNWELFFHVPLLIATRLSRNQRFSDAQRWFHYIFNPGGNAEADNPSNIVQRYWNFEPFHDRARSDYESQSVKEIETMAATGPSLELKVAVEEWRSDPFNPYAVARLRTTAFQKTVVMKYIDNLIAWGDQLFRANTLETINEATLLYVLAAEILGPRREVIDRNVTPVVQTFNTLGKIGPLGNVLEQIELLAPASGGSASFDGSEAPDPPSDKILLFCIPENDKLRGYWDTVADRLFKIRHCMNIEGQVQQLPLFEPPIDPALLVRARAAGLSVSEVLQDIGVSLPNYRFSIMLQKANEVAAEVRNLGTELLSVLEKQDAEALSTLRSGQELRLLQAVRDVRSAQVDEAARNVGALEQSKAMAQAKKDYFESRQFMNDEESGSLLLSELSLIPMGISEELRLVASILVALGRIKVGAPSTAGFEVGPSPVGESIQTFASTLDAAAGLLSVRSQQVGRQGEFARRQDEWDYQANLATIELAQIDQQLAAANIRFAIAQNELKNHDQQTGDARDTDEFLRNKFTNQDLFQWMIGQSSSVYFQSYQMAYDLAKRAEMCMQHELGMNYGDTSIIQFGYWDSLKRGLLAGDRLSHDLRRLEIAYLDSNVREYELTKHVSLVSLDPLQLLALKETGECQIDVPEWLFDLDTPGHYRRRLKMVSVTIPCVTGPYTTIHCQLVLLKSSYRLDDSGDVYEKSANDSRFIEDRRILDSIVTSTGQNDAGLFEPTMRDERYLPFEGAGAISRWNLKMPTDFKTFDYDTISDVVLHLRFTSRSSDVLRDKSIAALKKQLADVQSKPLSRLVSIRHEFPTEWHRFVTSTPSASTPSTLTLNIEANRFPYFVQGKTLTVETANVVGRTANASSAQFSIVPGSNPPIDLNSSSWNGQASLGPWTIATNADPKQVKDIFVVLAYSAS